MPQNMNEYNNCDDVKPRESIAFFGVMRSLVITLLKIFPFSLTVREFEKSVEISQSYRYKFASSFLEHSVHKLQLFYIYSFKAGECQL